MCENWCATFIRGGGRKEGEKGGKGRGEKGRKGKGEKGGEGMEGPHYTVVEVITLNCNQSM